MAYEFKDIETIVVDADLLNICIPGQNIETPRRRTEHNNLFWWLRCYPNGAVNDNKGHVGVFVFTSIGGFHAERAATVDRSDVKDSSVEYYTDPMHHGWPLLASHEEIRSGSAIKNGKFVIRCKINFKIDPDKLQVPIPFHEDGCTVQLDRKTLQTYKVKQSVDKEKQILDSITWWVRCFPCGNTEDDQGYVSVYFHVEGGPIKVDYSCAMSIGGVFIQMSVPRLFTKSENRGISKWFSHQQCQLADHSDNVIDLVCKVKISKPLPSDLITTSNKTPAIKNVRKTCFKDTITVSFLECQLNGNEGGDYNGTDMKFAKGSNKYQWRVLHFPAGILAPSKGYVGLIVEATTTDTNTVFMNGVIRIDGSPFEKKFEMLVEKDSSLSFPKLISHEDLRRNGGIIDSKISITCEVTFEDYLFIL